MRSTGTIPALVHVVNVLCTRHTFGRPKSSYSYLGLFVLGYWYVNTVMY